MGSFQKKDYSQYEVADFLLDDDFRQWVLHPSVKSSLFWPSWIAQHPHKSEVVNQAAILIKSMRIKKQEPAEEVVLDIWDHIEQKTTSKKTIGFIEKKQPSHVKLFFKVAAVIVLITGLTLLFYQLPMHQKTVNLPPQFVSKRTLPGEKIAFVLEDGTKVKLNSGSGLVFPSVFGVKERRVKLEGEAFFEVTQDVDRPFIIESGDLITRVVGTSFNIKSYAGEQVQEVAVVTGKVKVIQMEGAKPAYEAIANPGEMIAYDKQNAAVVKSEFNEEEIIGWKNGILYFEKASLPQMITLLERWYGVSIYLDPDLSIDKNWRHTGKYENKSLEYILEVLSYASGFQYEIKGDEVKITKPEK